MGEMVRTSLSLSQMVTRFAKSALKTAFECEDLLLREQLMVGLQASLLHSMQVRVIAMAKAISYPIVLVEPSMLAAVRALCSSLASVVDAAVIWDACKSLEESTRTDDDVDLGIL